MAHVREITRADGRTAFEARWRDGGKFRQRTFTVKRDAERFALKVENGIAAGESTDLLTRNGKTVRDVVEGSMEASRPELKPRTYRSYRAIYDNRILPRFGARRVSSVTRAEVQAFVAELHGAGLAPATVHHHYVALRKAMRFAQEDRLIVHNPCDGVRLPKSHEADQFEPVFLTAAEVGRLSAALDDREPYGLLIRFAAWTGLRAGEIAGLRVRDLNLRTTQPQVEVRQTMQRIAGEWVAGTPKSARSTRNVPLHNRELRSELRLFLLAHPRSGDPDALLWPGRAVGSHAVDYLRVFDVASFRRNYMRPALRSLGMREMRFHDLRHTFASLMLAVPEYAPRRVSHWMGHANLNTTDMIYGHLYESDGEADADALDAFLDRAAKASS